VILGAMIAEWRGEKQGLRGGAIANLSGHVIIAGFVIAHLFDAIAYHPEIVAERPWFLLEIWNGLSSFGGFLGAIVGALIWQRRYRASLLVAADPIAFSFPFGWLFGRIGCFVTHDHPGRVTQFFLGVEDYRVGWPPYQVRHDLGLYEVLWCLVMIPLFLLLSRKERPRGFYLGLLPMLYAPVRFGLDFLRATDIEMADARYFALTPGHYSALILFALGAIAFTLALRNPSPEIPENIALGANPVWGSPAQVRVTEEADQEARAVREERPQQRRTDAEASEERGLGDDGEGLRDRDGRPPREPE
jgi:phosphatidylglycerol:prolipoprotein diacylglycerol transferase